MSNGPNFTKEDVRNVICGIPGNRKGIPSRVVTYGDISVVLTGDKGSAQEVGEHVASLGEEFPFDEVPVHRVVKKDGYIPTKGGVKERNTKELEREGVCVLKDGNWQVENFEKIHWEIPEYKRPKSTTTASPLRRFIPDLPLVVWLMLLSVAIGIASNDAPQELIAKFNAGWGLAAGEFALILLPSFTLAAALERMRIQSSPALSIAISPFAGAGMICPDTAFAALSPMVKRQRLSLAFGSYCGFKLLIPAGPLIVATALGVADNVLLAYCVAIFIPVWAAGALFARVVEGAPSAASTPASKTRAAMLWQLWPLGLLAALLVAGFVFADLPVAWLAFSFNPKGALLITAVAALCAVGRSQRRECVESGVRATALLLLIICAASAFSVFLTAAFPVQEIFTSRGGITGLLILFALGALLKIMQGSSMATFAAAGPLALPVVAHSGIPPIFAVLAICLGSFIAILPNDSFYHLVRRGALSEQSEPRAIAILGGGATLQAAVGLAALLILYSVGG